MFYIYLYINGTSNIWKISVSFYKSFLGQFPCDAQHMCVIIFVIEILSSLVLFGFLKLPLCWLDDAAALHKLILKHWLCSNTFRIITSWNFDQPLVWYIIIRWLYLFMNCLYFVNSICSFKVIITLLLRHGNHLSNVIWSQSYILEH